MIVSATAKISLAAAYYIAKSKARYDKQREVAEAEKEAEEQWWQETLGRLAEDDRREFHEENDRWIAEVLEHEWGIQKQDEEIRRLEKRMR
jgi:hypothetical protein